MTKKIKNICYILLALCVLASWGYVCYLVRDTVLACHDSVMEYINARVNGWTNGYAYGMEYSLARGKVGFIFPAVIMFRFMVNGSGNYVAIWLLQYIPVFANVALLGAFFYKKINKVAGLFFPLFFFSFLQLDIWHCLITCYPLDFMYGLFLMISGLWLYSDYLENRGKRRNAVRLFISGVCFYESMQVYEAFIVASLGYAVIALYFTVKNKKGIKGFAEALVTHFLIAVAYVGILSYLRTHPVVDTAVPSIDPHIDIKRVAKTCYEFSTGMFPLKDKRIVPSVKDFFLAPVMTKKKMWVFALAGGFGTLLSAVLSNGEFKDLGKDERKAVCIRLSAVTVIGCLIAVTYPLPHSLVPSYQGWVIDGGAGGYLPTTISYFGWSTAIVSVILIASCLLSSVKKIYIPTAAALAIFVAAGAFITANINNVFRDIESFAGGYMSVKYRTLYDIFRDEPVNELGTTYFYVPAYPGVHSNIETDESLVEFESGDDVELINSLEGNEMLLQDNDAVYVFYDADAHGAFIMRIDDYGKAPEEWTTSEVYFFSCEDRNYEITLTDEDGEESYVRIHTEGGQITPVETEDTILVPAIDACYC